MGTHISSKPAVVHHDLHLHYTLTGIGDITLVFIHGALLDEKIWNAQVDYFNASYQVVTLDLAGHGQSGTNRNTWTIEQFGQDVIALLKALQLKNVILIGHSMGAQALLEAAVLYPQPIIGCIAIEAFRNTGYSFSSEEWRLIEHLESKLKNDFANTAASIASERLLSSNTPKTVSEYVLNAYRNAYAPMATSALIDAFHYTEREKELLIHLPFKLYLINTDYIPTNHEALDLYTEGSFEIFNIEGFSHFPMLENPRLLNDLLGAAITCITKTKNEEEQGIGFIED